MTEPIVVGGGARTGNRRALVLAGIAAAVLLAVVVLPGLLFGSGGGETVDDSFPPVASTTTVPTATADAPEETFEAFSSKNPFTPLIELATPASDPGSGTTVDTTATTLPVVDPLAPVGDPGFSFPIAGDGAVLPDTGTTPTTVAPAPPVRQPDRVALLEVYSDLGGRLVASVRINDATYGVAEGDEFAFSYRVLDLDLGTRCATLLFGDDRFGLCEGDETSK